MKNKTLSEWFDKAFPHGCFWWILVAVAWNMAVYYGSRLITTGLPHYSIALPIDAKIPLFLPAVVPYVLSYPFWLFNYWLIARENKETCRRVITAEILAKTVCLIVFIAFPTAMERPLLTGSDPFSRVLRIIYTDPADNLLPSIHCLESWFCFRGLKGCKKVPSWYHIVSFFFALSVFASTVLVKQHVILDCPSAVLLAEGCLLISHWYWDRKNCLNKKG